MANTLTHVIPQLLAQGLMALREQAFLPRIVNRGYDRMAGERGSTIDVPIPSAIAASAVSPSYVPAANAPDISPTKVAVALDQWYEAEFYLTDKEVLEVMDGVIPMQASEAVKALANNVNNAIFALYKDVYGFVGTPATTPFATDTSAATGARKTLNTQLAPMSPRYVVLDPDAMANALGLRAFQDQSWRQNASGIIEGQISRTLGFDWFEHQLAPSHTAGTGTGYLVNNAAGYAVGVKTIAVDTGTGTGLVGDIITFAGHSQTYVITSAIAAGSVSFYPGLAAAVADDEAITIKASHAVNLAFHRDAFVFATRPLANATFGLGNFQSAVDPESGLALRLEVSREHRQTRFAYDILYGVKTVRPELATRIVG